MFTKLIERLVTLLALLGLGVTVLIAARAFGIHIPDPFTHQRVDNSQPPLLKSIQKLSRYHAAQGHYEVVVDLGLLKVRLTPDLWGREVPLEEHEKQETGQHTAHELSSRADRRKAPPSERL